MVLVKISTSSEFTIYQHVQPYGVYDKDIALTSDGLNLLAFICDIKEVRTHTALNYFLYEMSFRKALSYMMKQE